jgi:receptor protein-tyrosine kinase
MPVQPTDAPQDAATANDQTGLRRQVRVIRRRFPIVLICAVLAPAAALAYSLNQPTEYTAKSVLYFRNPAFDNTIPGQPNTGGQPVDPTREAATNLRLVSLSVVADRAARAVDRRLNGQDLAKKIDISQEGDSDLVGIAATDRSKVRAARIANAFGREYIAFRRDADRSKINQAKILAQNELRGLTGAAADGQRARLLRQRIDQLETIASLVTGNAELVQLARPPSSPSAPTPRRDAAFALAFGLLLGVGLAFLVDRLDRRLRDPKEIEETVRRPVLGTVPSSRVLQRGRIGDRPLPPGEAEAFRMLRANLRYFNVDRDIKSVLITSAAPGDGKSTVAANLAFASAEAGTKTMLIEADLRRPTLAGLLGANLAPGLTNLLAADAAFDEVVQKVPVPGRPDRSLDVVIAGPIPPNPTDLMESDALRQVVRDAEADYELVVIDTPPTSVVSDAIPLVTQTSGVIVVARLGKTTREGLVYLRDQLALLEAHTLGLVVNSMGRDSGGAYRTPYVYSYGYATKAETEGVAVTTGPVAVNGHRKDEAEAEAKAEAGAESWSATAYEPEAQKPSAPQRSGGLLGRAGRLRRG